MTEEEPVSNCCGANFGFPGWPDCDICSACGDHAGPEEEEFDDESTWKEKEEYLDYQEKWNERKGDDQC